MRIPVLGMDPSLRNWGLAEGILDLETGILDHLVLTLVETEVDDTKQVRKNSKDLVASEILAKTAFEKATQAKIVFAEIPVGSQSAAAMKSYGVCIGIMGAMRVHGIQIIEVDPKSVKKNFTGNPNATKEQMIQKALEWYPTANFPRERGKATGRVIAKAEHVADAIATIHAGVQTPEFTNLMKLLSKV
jgi:Holliday junction resolvasome RuvABC endonuclease subunit